tara:strand:- start:39 stop:1727 length:1689 start_codon:yes stop_codon:yes gene_type:complete
MALTDVIDRLIEVNEEQLVETQDIKIEIETLSDRMGSLLELNKQDKLERLEAMREGAGISAPSMTAGGVANDKTGGLFNLGKFGILDLMGLSALFARVKLIFGVIGSIVVTLSRVFGGGALAALEGTLKLLQGSFKLLEDLAFKLRNLPGFGKLANFLARITLAFEDMATKVGNRRKELLGPLKFLGNIGKVFGKLFWPLTVFMTAWAGVKGFIEGFREDGILGGIQGAVEGMFNTLVSAPLQLITDAVGWLLGKLGWEEGKKFFENFNFAEFFGGFFDSIFGNIRIVFDNIGDLFRGEFSWKKAKETLIALLKIFTPIGMIEVFFNKALDFIKNIFNFGDPDKPFNLSTFIEGIIADAVALFTNIFQGLINKLRSIPILSKFFKSDEEKELDAEIKALNEQLKQQNKAADRLQSPEYKLQRIGDPDRIAPINGFFMSEEKKEELRDEKRANVAKLKDELATFTSEKNRLELAKSVTEEKIRKVEIQRQQIQTGRTVQQLNSAAGASGGGTTVVYQTTNNVSGGGGGGGASAVNAGSGSSAPSNDYHGTLDATQVIGGAPNR